MKAVILAGGFGTRISEESRFKPKPMIEIGGMPILWHIMKIYSAHGINDFIICAGYKQHVIKKWFADYFLYTSDVTFDFRCGGDMIVHENRTEPWRVTVVDTGLETMTGGRLLRIKRFVDGETFCLTYGDAVSDVDIGKLIEFHKNSGKCVTLTSVNIPRQKGLLDIDGEGTVTAFMGSSDGSGENGDKRDFFPINGGFMVCEPEVFDYIDGDDTVFEREPMRRLSKDGELKAFSHSGFWQCMDTKREKDILERLWNEKNAPWKIWEE